MENTKTKIREIIVAYKADFERVNGEERYKWIAVKCFQDNWDIDAPDFHAMLVKAFEKRANLIGSSYYFPYKVLAEFASLEPETVRTLFHHLYDETLPLDERIVKFQQAFEPFVKRQNLQYDNWKQSFQDLHAVSVYLAFKYPDKYYIFKSSIYKKLAAYVEFAPKHDKKAQYANYTDLFDVVHEVVVEDDELTAMSRGRLTEDCFADSNYRMLAMDIAYFGYWVAKDIAEQQPLTTDNVIVSENRTNGTVHYWLYAPGPNAQYWDTFRGAGIMAIGWESLGDLREFATKADIQEKGIGKNDAHCCWQFANDIKVGDVVFVKQGLHKIIGRGEVTGSYQFDATQPTEDYKNIRTVKWTHSGSWEYPTASGAVQAPLKTLTDLTQYVEMVQKIEECFIDDVINSPDEKSPVLPILPSVAKYDATDFLEDVYMERKQYDTLVGLLKHSNNLILQGAPGVGKTYAAKRLAWSIMGEQDETRIQLVQFHQSYSYEDFIMGIRPTTDANKPFEVKNGAFYDFCKKAAEDDENDYFFIIDEINRGNISKIFGELLMLIENEHRGEEVRLLYRNELFSVPKNLCIIGMMNTADRSLALMDFALRRRFSFYDIEPAFETENFRDHQETVDNPKFDKLIEAVCKLNDTISIDPLLGKGFRIGHSYFCDDSYDDEKLNAIIEYNLIPLLAEYWVDEPSKAEQWSKTLQGALNGD
ncbi:hypothetical protein FACS189499_07100 [Clostridia bacterium]|nr:hypothetical protein FACS189499_07100 [Clostridia bacterium]